ncbi:MAG TPA: hypothetical protein P5270_04790 [Victivallales bacterium]|nr:hypothetical protein [Victivallales bacterium]HPO90433.1 hypothetical protein [Victivallales bacterium]HRR28659.1 hypothetical protein [Victivallales bacterium]
MFKKCPKCNSHWKNRNQFINDKRIEIIGYQAHFEHLEAGLFLFNHYCGTTLALEVDLFKDLYNGEIFQKNKRGSNECPKYCLNRSELRPCPAKCECAFVREIIQLIKAKKNKSS